MHLSPYFLPFRTVCVIPKSRQIKFLNTAWAGICARLSDSISLTYVLTLCQMSRRDYCAALPVPLATNRFQVRHKLFLALAIWQRVTEGPVGRRPCPRRIAAGCAWRLLRHLVKPCRALRVVARAARHAEHSAMPVSCDAAVPAAQVALIVHDTHVLIGARLRLPQRRQLLGQAFGCSLAAAEAWISRMELTTG